MGKSNRWWIRGLPLRRLKTYRLDRDPRCAFYHDGVCFSVRQWDAALNEVRALRPGDPIWNPYTGTWDKVAKVVFEWTPTQRLLSRTSFRDGGPERLGRQVGSHIDYFRIETASGHWVYDPPSWTQEWVPASRHPSPPDTEQPQ